MHKLLSLVLFNLLIGCTYSDTKPSDAVPSTSSSTAPSGAPAPSGDKAAVTCTLAGKLDASFGSGGLAKLANSAGSSSSADTLAIQPDGKIVVGGLSASASSSTYDTSILVRFLSDGSVDSTFGGSGIVFTAGTTGFWDLFFEPISDQTKILRLNLLSGSTTYQSEISRFNADGSADTGFRQVPQPYDRIKTLKIRPDGKIFGAGSVGAWGFPGSPGTQDAAVFVMNPDGSADTAFASNGMLKLDMGASDVETFEQLMQTDDGKFVVAGYALAYKAGSSSNDYDQYPILARFNADGTLDTSFPNGPQNSSLFQISQWRYSSEGMSLIPQPEGRFLLAGGRFQTNQGQAYLVRYNSDGSVDTSFGAGGLLAFPTTDIREPWAVLAQGDGKYIVEGYGTGSDSKRLVRYNADLSLDTTFGANGVLEIPFLDNHTRWDGSCRVLIPGWFENSLAVVRIQ